MQEYVATLQLKFRAGNWQPLFPVKVSDKKLRCWQNLGSNVWTTRSTSLLSQCLAATGADSTVVEDENNEKTDVR